jgi:hypothetical protein
MKTRGRGEMSGLEFSFKPETQVLRFKGSVGNEFFETTAVSKDQARIQIAEQFNKKYNLSPGTRQPVGTIDQIASDREIDATKSLKGLDLTPLHIRKKNEMGLQDLPFN